MRLRTNWLISAMSFVSAMAIFALFESDKLRVLLLSLPILFFVHIVLIIWTDETIERRTAKHIIINIMRLVLISWALGLNFEICHECLQLKEQNDIALRSPDGKYIMCYSCLTKSYFQEGK